VLLIDADDETAMPLPEMDQWPCVAVTAKNYARLMADFGVSKNRSLNEQFALLRPDLYSAGILRLQDLEVQLSGLGFSASSAVKAKA
jgi:hypothetical protein